MSLISEHSRTWEIRHLREDHVEHCHGKDGQDEKHSRAFKATVIGKAQLAFEHLFESLEYSELMVARDMASAGICLDELD